MNQMGCMLHVMQLKMNDKRMPGLVLFFVGLDRDRYGCMLLKESGKYKDLWALDHPLDVWSSKSRVILGYIGRIHHHHHDPHDDDDDERMWPHEVRCLFDFPVISQTQMSSRVLSYLVQQHGEGVVRQLLYMFLHPQRRLDDRDVFQKYVAVKPESINQYHPLCSIARVNTSSVLSYFTALKTN